MLVTICKKLEPIWGTVEEFKKMSDEEIIELLNEDTSLLLDGAVFTFTREEGEVPDGK